MPTIDLAEFVVLEAIPLLETGIAYPASTGPFTPTSTMLEEAVAAQADPHVPAPRIKIGHVDNPLNAEFQDIMDDLNKGLDSASEPALGTIQNMEIDNEGQTLIGDLYGVPSWLAAILSTAYPARSIEGGAWKNDANNKEYAFCLTALSLLGVAWPGCTSLSDLQDLFSKDGPELTVIEMPRKLKAKASALIGGKSKGGSLPVIAQVNVEDIRRAFYEDFAQDDRYWWWDRELLIDPLEMIVQDPDDGQLYRVSIETSGDNGVDSVTFGDPKAVKIKYVPDSKPSSSKDEVKAERLIAPQLENAGVVLAVNTTPPRASERQNRRTPEMAVNIPALRERLGLTAEQLPDDATEEQVNEAISAPTPGTSPDPTNSENPEQGEPGTPEVGAPQPGQPTEGGSNAGFVGPGPSEVNASGTMVDAETLAQLQRDAAAGREARTHQLQAERTAFVQAAVSDGRIPPSRRDHYLTLMSRDDAGTREFLSSLAPGSVVPTGELGHGEDVSASASDYIDTHLSPEERSRIAASRQGQQLDDRIVLEA